MKLTIRLREIVTDDATVKLIFDHVRNLGLCALMTGAAAYVFAYPEKVFPYTVPALIYGSLLYLSAGLLTILNAMHALGKAMMLSNPWEKYSLVLLINMVGPVMIIALITAGPFGP